MGSGGRADRAAAGGGRAGRRGAVRRAGLRGEADALLRAVTVGGSRFGDAGRGRGLRRVGETVAGWGGRMRVRSRTVVLAGAPPWHDPALRDPLPFLPGVQVEVVLPSPPRPRAPLGTAPPIA